MSGPTRVRFPLVETVWTRHDGWFVPEICPEGFHLLLPVLRFPYIESVGGEPDAPSVVVLPNRFVDSAPGSWD